MKHLPSALVVGILLVLIWSLLPSQTDSFDNPPDSPGVSPAPAPAIDAPSTLRPNLETEEATSKPDLNAPMDASSGMVTGFAQFTGNGKPEGQPFVELVLEEVDSDASAPGGYFYKYLSNDNSFQFEVPPGSYRIKLNELSNQRWGPLLEVPAGGSTSYNFVHDSGFEVYGAFQVEATPSASTFTLDVLRQTDNSIVSRSFLAGAPAYGPKNNNQFSSSDIESGDRPIDGGFRVKYLQSGLYTFRFSMPPKNPSDPPVFVWEYEVEVKDENFDFGIQYADFSDYSEELGIGSND